MAKSGRGKSNGKAGKGRGSRKSRAEASTGAQEATVEVRTGELGLGEPIVIDSKTFHFHLKAYKSALEKKDSSVGLLRSCRSAAKMVNEHLPAAIAECVKEERSSDPAKLKARLEVLGIALKETGSPVQLSVHDTLLGDVKEQAYQRGFNAGQNGQVLNNIYPPTSDLADSYATGWRNGMAKNAGLNEAEAAAAVAKGGGPEDEEEEDDNTDDGEGEEFAEVDEDGKTIAELVAD